MTGRDFFGALIRAIGIWFVVHGLFDCWHLAAREAGISFVPTDLPIDRLLNAIAEYFVLGIVTLAAAGPISRLMYK